MRIAQITGSFLPRIGGVEWKVHHLSRELQTLGHDVEVFTTYPGALPLVPEMPVDHSYKVHRCAITMGGMGRLGVTNYLVSRAISREHRKRPFDVLHTHHLGNTTRIGIRVREKIGVPVVATTCGEDVQINEELSYGVRLDPEIEKMVRQNLVGVDAVGSISSSVRSEIVELAPGAAIHDIPNGVAWDDFQTGATDYFQERYGLDDSAIVIVSLGRNHPKKGYETGIQAVSRVILSNERVRYFIFGKSVDELQPLVDSMKLEKRVFLPGPVPMDEVPSVLRSADVFFNPSLMEGFAQVNVQALACGCPLVITDAPGNRDAGDYGGALIAKDGDPDSMASALVELTGNTDRRKSLGQEAAAVSSQFSWASIAKQYLSVYRDVSAKPESG